MVKTNMEKIDFGWPWDNLVEMVPGSGVLVGGNKILTPNGNGMIEHFWFKGTTLFRKVNRLETRDSIKIDKHVYNVVFERMTSLILIDYRMKRKVVYKADDFENLMKEGRLKEEGQNIVLPILDVQVYEPDRMYRKFNQE